MASLEAVVRPAAPGPTLGGKGTVGGGGKPGGGGTTGGGSVSVVLLNSSDGKAHFSEQVTFNVSASVSQPWVNLNCYQGSTWVDGEWGGFFAGSAWGTTFTLGPTSLWVSGGANCTASLVYYNSKGSLTTLGTTSFPVYP